MYKLLDELLEGKEFDMKEVELEKAIQAGQGIISHQRNAGSDLSFLYVLRAVRVRCPHTERETMEKFIASFTKEDNLRVAMEYALSNRDFSLCNKLITQLKETKKAKNVDWAKTYELTMLFQKRELPKEELYALLKKHSPKNKETKTLTDILKGYMFLYQQKWSDLKEIIVEINDGIKAITNKYIKCMFEIRLHEVLSHISLHYFNDPCKARKSLEHIKEAEFSSKFKIHMDYVVAKTYMLEDYEKSLYYFERYVAILNEEGDKHTAQQVIEKDIAFLKCYWNKDLQTVKTTELSELAHLNIKCGNIEKANELLDKLEKQNGKLSSFQKYFRGMANNSPELLYESLLEFVENGNFFFAQLPKRLLEKYPVFNVTANMLFTKFIEKGGMELA